MKLAILTELERKEPCLHCIINALCKSVGTEQLKLNDEEIFQTLVWVLAEALVEGCSTQEVLSHNIQATTSLLHNLILQVQTLNCPHHESKPN